jgi:acyl-CoA synthetase (AMP-forming)/AMP-acid ligase II
MLTVQDLRPLPPEVRDRHARLGVAGDASLPHLLGRTTGRWPQKLAVDDLHGGRRVSFHALDQEVATMAAFLRGRGAQPGDVVLLQASNALEAIVAWWAAWRIGAVAVPVVDILRTHELTHIVAVTRPEIVVTVAQHREHQPPAMFDALLDAAGIEPKALVLLEGEAPGWTPYAAALDEARAASVLIEKAGAPAIVGADDPALVLFTSGTTARSKGVVHSSRSLTADAAQFVRNYGVTWQDTCYLPVPLAHVTGMLFGLLVPSVTGGSTVVTRMQGLATASAEVVEHGATWTVGPTAQIPLLRDAHAERGVDRPALRIFATGGATFGPAELEIAEALGFGPCRSYGMTECPSVTAPSGADPVHQRLGTDGRLPSGVEVEAVEPGTRVPVGPGEEGELRVRGPERMVGYLDPDETREAVDSDGWFYSGDLGRVDAEACVTVTGRIKDIINRGGEKFSAQEIEEQLMLHPEVVQAAVIAAPDERYGEVPAVFLVGSAERAGEPELARWLGERGLARQKTPVHWRWLDELPMTPSGKVRKFVLRDELGDA